MSHSLHPLLSAGGFNQIFKKLRVNLTLGFRGMLLAKEGDIFEDGGYNFYIISKLKSEIFNDKRVDKEKCFSLS